MSSYHYYIEANKKRNIPFLQKTIRSGSRFTCTFSIFIDQTFEIKQESPIIIRLVQLQSHFHLQKIQIKLFYTVGISKNLRRLH